MFRLKKEKFWSKLEGESWGGNIKPDPLGIILFQVNNLVFVGKLSTAPAPALLMLKLFFGMPRGAKISLAFNVPK
jgi:hypothetical protein